jgi:hypothetical protein
MTEPSQSQAVRTVSRLKVLLAILAGEVLAALTMIVSNYAGWHSVRPG